MRRTTALAVAAILALAPAGCWGNGGSSRCDAVAYAASVDRPGPGGGGRGSRTGKGSKAKKANHHQPATVHNDDCDED